MMKQKYMQFMKRKQASDNKPDDQEIAKEAALAEDEYSTLKTKVV